MNKCTHCGKLTERPKASKFKEDLYLCDKCIEFTEKMAKDGVSLDEASGFFFKVKSNLNKKKHRGKNNE